MHVSPVFTSEFVEAKHLATQYSSDLILVNSLLWENLQQKSYRHDKRSKLLIIRSAFCFNKFDVSF